MQSSETEPSQFLYYYYSLVARAAGLPLGVLELVNGRRLEILSPSTTTSSKDTVTVATNNSVLTIVHERQLL